MNLAEIRQSVRDDIDEAEAAFWSDALLNRYINRSYRWCRSHISQLDEEFFQRTYEFTYPGGSREASLVSMGLPREPLSFVILSDITNDNDQGVKLDHITMSEAEEFYQSFDERTGVSSTRVYGPSYYLSGDAGGQRTMGYRPVPSTSRSLRAVVKTQTNELTRDQDRPDIPEDFHEAIILRAVILAKKREEAPVVDYERELARVMETAMMTLDGRHADNAHRVIVTDSEFYNY
mgnify:FL=1|tara:strand:+ start:1254 stop:1955 length:702 start_codon:yes stop_codon:yes gene_type:complete